MTTTPGKARFVGEEAGDLRRVLTTSFTPRLRELFLAAVGKDVR